MAVPCPGCGREYDVTLFQFGRTISCTCGARVGLEPRRDEGLQAAVRDPRFLVDAMLGRLARWLRLIGYDAAWAADVDDSRLVRRARHEDRILLTRDRQLLVEWRVPRAFLVSETRPLAQLREVVGSFDLDWRSGLFSRCSLCGARLAAVSPERVAPLVPPRILAEELELRQCPECGKVYWRGSHTDRMRRVLEQLLEED